MLDVIEDEAGREETEIVDPRVESIPGSSPGPPWMIQDLEPIWTLPNDPFTLD